MAKTLVKNISGTPLSFPLPYRGILQANESAVIASTPEAIIAALGGLENTQGTLELTQLASEATTATFHADGAAAVTAALGGTAPTTGTGTVNALTKFTGTSTVGNSTLSDDGTKITRSVANSFDSTASTLDNYGLTFKHQTNIYLQVYTGSTFTQFEIRAAGSGNYYGALRFNSANNMMTDAAAFVPLSDGTGDIGLSTNRWASFYSKLLSVKTHAAFANSEASQKTGAVQTTDATQTTAYALTLSDTTLYWVTAEVVGRDTGGTNRAGYTISALVYRQGGGATIQTGVVNVATVETAGASAWDATFTVSSNDLRVSVTGAAATTINWACTVKVQPVSGNA